jgi:hypothetical protein
VSDLEPGWSRRDLTDGEREELRAASARLRRFPPVLGLMTLMVGFVVMRALFASRSGVNLLLAAFGALVLATAFRRWRRAQGLAEGLLADAERGFAARGSGQNDGLEVLPVSRARWTERGAEASWRARLRGR